ncbi:MAG: 50S ribosomal protein L6 [Crenarchaeota archaeon]|nr:50S ribosomal protein L6 [Thermoproteota archaeon]MCR8487543.1 50S ribosomal protein L6 [Thermoproteota archaeon]MCR8501458.1 50S ribosomal protein L6 [Thermoproteota archaeon]
MIEPNEASEKIILEAIKRGGYGIDCRIIDVPSDVRVEIIGKIVRVEGPKGKIEKDFTHLPVYIIRDNNRIIVAGQARKRKQTKYLGTAATKIKKMIEGVRQRYVYIHKVVYRHFPPRVEVDKENKRILIKGLYGRRDTIQVPIYGDVEINIEYQAGSEIPDLVYLKGCDIEAVSLTSAALENACKLRGRYRKDIRVFFDGVWLWRRTKEE